MQAILNIIRIINLNFMKLRIILNLINNKTITLLLTSVICYFVFTSLNTKYIVYIYNDDGTSRESLQHTEFTLKKILSKKYIIKTIDADKIIKTNWYKNAILLLIPGGADLSYAKKLNGKGNKYIQNFIQKGGKYLGICAGSYYGSNYIEFDKNGPLEIIGNRELSFFPGKTIGPILAHYDYKSNIGARVANIKINNLGKIKNINLYFNGGGFFENAEQYPEVSVIGYYQQTNNILPAIIHIKYGKGHVILSGVHFEYEPYLLNYNDEYLKKIINDLIQTDPERITLLKLIFEKIDIKTR